MQNKLDVVNKLRAIYGDQFNFETSQTLMSDGKFKTFIDIKAKLKLSKTWKESINKTLDILRETFPKQEFTKEDGTIVKEHPFLFKSTQTDFGTENGYSLLIEIKIGDELDEVGATVFDKKQK